jgi:hypothetical protein
MWERVETARDDSDTALFNALMLMGEMITKITTVGLVAAVQADADRTRYRQLYRLVRANGVGEWSQVIEEVTNGHASNYLLSAAREEQQELNQKCKSGSWQYEAVENLQRCLTTIGVPEENLDKIVRGRGWFPQFVNLRNKTKGHGAIASYLYRDLCLQLEESIRKILDNFRLFRRTWAYLHLNISGKYRVTKLSDDVSPFEPLRSGRSHYLPQGDGVYVYMGEPLYVDLIQSDPDALDFFFANGNFKTKRFEVLSYITGNTQYADNSPYMAPPTERPPSVTQGDKLLEIHESVFSNLPLHPNHYINREELETELADKLTDDRNPVITLLGRGGIGKTSLSLSVLHKLSKQDEFEALLWFSARDIDLLEEGPKYVKPEVLTEGDVADVFMRLMGSIETIGQDADPLTYLAQALGGRTQGGPYLFIFDNFETVENPVQLFEWVNEYIRLPNKVLITTRFRQFKGDYPIEVSGMSYEETRELVDSEARRVGVTPLLTEDYRQDLYGASDGHPYVVKLFLGEVAKERTLVPIKNIIETKDKILEALFERTFDQLTPASKRVFLTLCSWRSAIPLLALEAVLLHSSEEALPVAEAVEELSLSSFVEIHEAQKDNSLFIVVPVAAAPFGKAQLDTSLLKNKIQSEMRLLHAFGVTKPADIQDGIEPQINNFFRYLERNPEEIESCLPITKFIARRQPVAWRNVIYLYESRGSRNALVEAKEAAQQYLRSSASSADQEWAWRKLADLCGRTSDRAGEINALLEMCQITNVPFRDISYTAGRFLTLFKTHDPLGYEEKRKLIWSLAITPHSKPHR